MSRKKVLVLGGNFGGLTAALSVQHELRGDVDVTVLSASDRFVFNPSLIWLPFGKRGPADISSPLAPTFEGHGIDFVHGEATRLPGPQSHRMKLAFEKYFLWKAALATSTCLEKEVR